MRENNFIKRIGLGLCSTLVFVSSLFVPDEAEGVPAFARKYNANCALCHSSEPRLTPFGQKFLENGYQFPGTTDGGSAAKTVLDGQQGPVMLDEISNIMAIRIRADIEKASFKTVTDDMKAEGVDERVNLEMPKIINVFFAGTVKENLSYFLESEYNTMEAEGGETSLRFERAFMQFSNLGGKQGAANLKVGVFDPSSLFSFPTHRQQMNPILPKADTNKFPPEILRIPMLPYAFSSKFYGMTTSVPTAPGSVSSGGIVGTGSEDMSVLPFQPYLYNAPSQKGLSIHGRPMGDGTSLLYQVGIAYNTKAGSNEQRTDNYFMLRWDQHLAGMDMQFSLFQYNAPDAVTPTMRTYTVGACTGGTCDAGDDYNITTMSAVDIKRTGIGVRSQWGNFDVYGAYIKDELGMNASALWEPDADGLSLEADWRFHENYMLGMRYDQMSPGGMKSMLVDNKMLSVIGKYYPSPNISLYARMHSNMTDDATMRMPMVMTMMGSSSIMEMDVIHPASNFENMIAVGVDMAF